jgi:hypothetical protein
VCRRFVLPLLLSVIPGIASAQSLTVDLSWGAVTNTKILGYRIYKGDSADPSKMSLFATVSPTTLKLSIPWTDGDAVKCFAVAAYNGFGESSKTAKMAGGVDVCLGKPLAPQEILWSVR